LLGGDSVELRDGERTSGLVGVVSGLEESLLGDGEDEVASLASPRRLNVNVEDGAVDTVDRSKVLSTVGLVRGGRVDGDDEVRVGVKAGEVLGADVGGRLRHNRAGSRSNAGSGGRSRRSDNSGGALSDSGRNRDGLLSGLRDDNGGSRLSKSGGDDLGHGGNGVADRDDSSGNDLSRDGVADRDHGSRLDLGRDLDLGLGGAALDRGNGNSLSSGSRSSNCDGLCSGRCRAARLDSDSGSSRCGCGDCDGGSSNRCRASSLSSHGGD